MLILSRRSEQQIIFPNLGIRLSILQVRGRIVKVGIEAPSNIKILRGERLPSSSMHEESPLESGVLVAADSAVDTEDAAEAEHRRRNELNVLQLRLDAIQQRIDRGETVDTQMVIDTLSASVKLGKPRSAEGVPEFTDLPASSFAGTRPTRLLVVEDSDNERGLMAYLLASRGFVVHVARDGAEAFDQLRNWSTLPDVVLMDMHMPLYNGLEALRRIREDERMNQLLVYAVTGSRRVVADEPVGRSWDRWFAKPVDVGQLVKAIQEDILSNHRVVESVSSGPAETGSSCGLGDIRCP